MFDLRALQVPAVFRITGRRRLAIYAIVILCASIMFWDLVHQEHAEKTHLQPGASGMAPLTISLQD